MPVLMPVCLSTRFHAPLLLGQGPSQEDRGRCAPANASARRPTPPVDLLCRFGEFKSPLNELRALLAQRRLQECADRDRFDDKRIEVTDPRLGHLTPALRRRTIRRTIKQQLDLADLEAHEFSNADDS